jgi:hypothetical protein
VEIAFGSHRTEGWVGPRAGPNAVEERKITVSLPNNWYTHHNMMYLIIPKFGRFFGLYKNEMDRPNLATPRIRKSEGVFVFICEVKTNDEKIKM